MKIKNTARFIAALSVLALFAGSWTSVWACRYNVRETGFVDLGVESYHLYCFVDEPVSEGLSEQMEQTLTELLYGSRLAVELVDKTQQPDHPVLKFLNSADFKGAAFPKAILFSPRGEYLEIDIDWSAELTKGTLPDRLSELVSSPVRDLLVEELSTAYAVVFLIEGASAEENERFRGLAARSIQTIESEMEFMPKQIRRGPLQVTLKREAFPSEKFLLWGLGLEEKDLVEPYLAVFYGKGRWIGPLMRSENVDENLLTNILAVVGADCECGLDPRMIRGLGLLVSWSQQLQATVTEELGFDPENPMVRVEVSQIMRLSSMVDSRLLGSSGEPAADFDDLPVPLIDSEATLNTAEGQSDLWYLLPILAVLAVLVIAIGLGRLLLAKRRMQ